MAIRSPEGAMLWLVMAPSRLLSTTLKSLKSPECGKPQYAKGSMFFIDTLTFCKEPADVWAAVPAIRMPAAASTGKNDLLMIPSRARYCPLSIV
jgi:hypothetical protein